MRHVVLTNPNNNSSIQLTNTGGSMFAFPLDNPALLPPLLGVVGLICAFIIYRIVLRYPAGEDKIKKIADQIHIGAMVFMRREYTMLAIFAAVLLVLIYFSDLGSTTALAFLVGALSSATAGWLGMFSATKANIRTATAANTKGASAALSVAFFGGSIMGLCVASLGLIGLGSLFYYFGGDPHTAHTLHGFGMGASVVALFSRVGGGIFTKSADVGADLVGKIEAGIPEDDPRNPGVIADNVGDNVGDVAGMGSDIFESYCGAMIASIAIAATMSTSSVQNELMFLPLALASVGLLASMLGIVLIRLRSASSPGAALRSGTLAAPVLFVAAAWFVMDCMGIGTNIWYAVLSGAVGGILIGLITEYYTGGSPVRKIARSGETGPATVMITGLAVGMQSVVLPVLFIGAIIYISTDQAGLYGVGIAAVGMLSTVGITMAIDAYGPVADNAGGIAEMGRYGRRNPENHRLAGRIGQYHCRHRQRLCYRCCRTGRTGHHCGLYRNDPGQQCQLLTGVIQSDCVGGYVYRWLYSVPDRLHYHDCSGRRGLRYDSRDPPSI